MSESTIYRRHEARRRKTIALRDDPRSAPIRVLSGLPGIRCFIKPYDPNPSALSNPAVLAPSNPLSKKTMPSSTMMFTVSGIASPIRYDQLLMVTLVTAGVGTIGTALSGTKSPLKQSPFHPSHASPRFGSMAVLQTSSAPLLYRSPPGLFSIFRGLMPCPQIMVRSAVNTGAVFGVKVAVEQCLCSKGQKGNNQVAVSLESITASATAGACLTVTKQVPFQQIPVQISAVVSYFSIFELLSNGREHASTLSTILAGATAGAVYEGMIISAAAGVNLPATSLPLLQSLGRSAPRHALVLFAYDSVMSRMKSPAN